jgi:hypothetical protein
MVEAWADPASRTAVPASSTALSLPPGEARLRRRIVVALWRGAHVLTLALVTGRGQTPGLNARLFVTKVGRRR